MKCMLAALVSFAIPAFGQSLNGLFQNVKAQNLSLIRSNARDTLKFRIRQDGIGDASNLSDPNINIIYRLALAKIPALKQAVDQAYDDNGCRSNGHFKDDPDIICGYVSPAKKENTVLTAFVRDGWAETVATYLSTLTFSDHSTGHDTHVALLLTWDVDAQAIGQESDGDKPTFEVTVKLSKIKRVPPPRNVEKE